MPTGGQALLRKLFRSCATHIARRMRISAIDRLIFTQYAMRDFI
jgi:hypothetical protein